MVLILSFPLLSILLVSFQFARVLRFILCLTPLTSTYEPVIDWQTEEVLTDSSSGSDAESFFVERDHVFPGMVCPRP